MRCDELREKLIAYVDRELPDNETAACDAHLAECEACAARVAERRNERDRWRNALRDDAPAELRQEILAGRAPRATIRFERKHVGRKTLWPAWAAAAVLAVIVLGQVVARRDARDDADRAPDAFTRPGAVAHVVDGEVIGAFTALEQETLVLDGGFL